MWSTLPFCLEQSLRGQHYLFEARLIRESFGEPLDIDQESIAATSRLMEALRAHEDLGVQRRTISELPPSAQRLFVRLYFDFLEGWAKEQRPTVH